MVELASISDVIDVALRTALAAGRNLRGVTASEPNYVAIPAAGVEGAVNEFVVDVYLIKGNSQAVVLGSVDAGIAKIDNVLVAHEAVGEIIGKLNVPVELERSASGQLTVIGRSKIALPQLQLDEYSLVDLGMLHLAEYTRNSAGVLVDGFCRPVVGGTQALGASVRSVATSTTRLSTLAELSLDDDGNFVGLDVNPLQRTIRSVGVSYEVDIVESLSITETEEAE